MRVSRVLRSTLAVRAFMGALVFKVPVA